MFLIDKLNAMQRNDIVSGQLFFRKVSDAVSLDFSTRIVYGVAGIIAVPENVNLKGEHQYTIAGYENKIEGIILGMGLNGIDLTEHARGQTFGSLLLSPIWRL